MKSEVSDGCHYVSKSLMRAHEGAINALPQRGVALAAARPPWRDRQNGQCPGRAGIGSRSDASETFAEEAKVSLEELRDAATRYQTLPEARHPAADARLRGERAPGHPDARRRRAAHGAGHRLGAGEEAG